MPSPLNLSTAQLARAHAADDTGVAAASAPLLAVAGPTGSGKSSVALQLAQRLNGAIISCDSVQVYRGFQIGCAKPTTHEQARVPHHLIDVADWNTPYDAETYRQQAEAAIAKVRAAGQMPIICGGTGLYLRALRFGLLPTPPADATLRAELQAQEDAKPGSLYARLQALDPTTAQRTEPNNLVHVIRALEITLRTGQPASVLRAAHGFRKERMPMRVVALDWATPALRERIAHRAQAMLDQGLVAEVRGLLRAGVSPDCRPMRAVGYKEAVAVLTNQLAPDELHAAIVASTWQYARRQRTWLRREPGVQFVSVSEPADLAAAAGQLETELAK